MIHKRFFLIAFTFAITLLSGAQAASARQFTVDNDFAQCPNAQFQSVQAAVNAANPGDSIRVCPGVYKEQVTITKNDLTLFASQPRAANIMAPATIGADPYAVVLINGAQGIVFRGFTVSGPLPDVLFCSTDLRAGISVIGGGSALIQDNSVVDIRSTSPSLRGCQNGFGITVGRGSQGQSGTATIQRNNIFNYQKGGIYVDGPGSSADILNNDIRGVGNSPVIAANGIQVSRSATVLIRNNRIDENRYTGGLDSASGIIAFQAGSLNIANNVVQRNDLGIVILDQGGLLPSIALAETARIAQNDTSYNTFDGISLYNSRNVMIERNNSFSNRFDGIYIFSDSTNNTIRRNRMQYNYLYDAEDISSGSGTGGTANTWNRNRCDTDNRGGALCTTEEDAGDPGSPYLLPRSSSQSNLNGVRIASQRPGRYSLSTLFR